MTNVRTTIKVKPEAIRVKYRCPSCHISVLRRLSEGDVTFIDYENQGQDKSISFVCECGCEAEIVLSRVPKP